VLQGRRAHRPAAAAALPPEPARVTGAFAHPWPCACSTLDISEAPSPVCCISEACYALQCVEVVLGLISDSLDAWRTRQYDYYQRCALFRSTKIFQI